MLAVIQAQSGSQSSNSDLLHNRVDEEAVKFLGTGQAALSVCFCARDPLTLEAKLPSRPLLFTDQPQLPSYDQA